MKAGRFAFVGIFCIAMLIVSGAYADKPEDQGKPGKPPFTNKECIVFTGELQGKQVVEGCCPNRGPFPEYTMTLSSGILEGFAGTYDGHIYVNQYRPGRMQPYMVEFWTDDLKLRFMVIGGSISEETRNKLAVDFNPDNSVCDDLALNKECLRSPTFTLVRLVSNVCP